MSDDPKYALVSTNPSDDGGRYRPDLQGKTKEAFTNKADPAKAAISELGLLKATYDGKKAQEFFPEGSIPDNVTIDLYQKGAVLNSQHQIIFDMSSENDHQKGIHETGSAGDRTTVIYNNNTGRTATFIAVESNGSWGRSKTFSSQMVDSLNLNVDPQELPAKAVAQLNDLQEEFEAPLRSPMKNAYETLSKENAAAPTPEVKGEQLNR